ncbi:Calcineurin-like_phosphoesterase [Hexamita inflata]|uniref:Calcineurin-like phosphoesterase n=1 Tax=Hexamita inflata TaxID=28002 RepID=A0AA86PJ74_9EUKA|nr:Calcineurin-like phosphoesterase [Hexamita inflata]
MKHCMKKQRQQVVEQNNSDKNNIIHYQDLPEDDNIINITFISDTHEEHNKLDGELYNGDILVHTGDLTNGENDPSDLTPIKVFLDWFQQQPYKYKIFIGGNHDFAMRNDEKFALLLKQYPSVNYLCSSSVSVTLKNQTLKFYGIPFVTYLKGWTFYVPNEKLQQTANSIEPCDILLTHDVPYHSKSLLQRVNEIKPKIHAFGHMHEHAGVIVKDGVTFINGAQMGFPVYDHIYKPIRVNLSQNGVQIPENVKLWNEFPK